MTSSPNSSAFKFPSPRKSGGSPPDLGKSDLPSVSSGHRGNEGHDEHIDEAGHHKRHSLRQRVSSIKNSILRKSRKSDSHTNGVVGGLALAFANQAQGVVFARSASETFRAESGQAEDAHGESQPNTVDRPSIDVHSDSSSGRRSPDLPHTHETSDTAHSSHDFEATIFGGKLSESQPHVPFASLPSEDPDFDENDIDHGHAGVPMESIESVFDSFVAPHSPPRSSVIIPDSDTHHGIDHEQHSPNSSKYSKGEGLSPSPSLESFSTHDSEAQTAKPNLPDIPDGADSNLPAKAIAISIPPPAEDIPEIPKPGVIDSGISISADSIELVCSSSPEDNAARDRAKRVSSLSLYDMHVEQQKSSSDLQGKIQASMGRPSADEAKCSVAPPKSAVAALPHEEGEAFSKGDSETIPIYKITTAAPSERGPRTAKPSKIPEEFDDSKDEIDFSIPYYLPTLIAIAIVVIAPQINRWLR